MRVTLEAVRTALEPDAPGRAGRAAHRGRFVHAPSHQVKVVLAGPVAHDDRVRAGAKQPARRSTAANPRTWRKGPYKCQVLRTRGPTGLDLTTISDRRPPVKCLRSPRPDRALVAVKSA